MITTVSAANIGRVTPHCDVSNRLYLVIDSADISLHWSHIPIQCRLINTGEVLRIRLVLPSASAMTVGCFSTQAASTSVLWLLY